MTLRHKKTQYKIQYKYSFQYNIRIYPGQGELSSTTPAFIRRGRRRLSRPRSSDALGAAASTCHGKAQLSPAVCGAGAPLTEGMGAARDGGDEVPGQGDVLSATYAYIHRRR